MNGIKAGYIDIGVGYDSRQVDRMLKDLKRQISQTPLLPVADLGNLHEFNRVMASKKADWRDLNREIDNNPLTPKFDGTELKELSKQVATVRAELKKEIRGAVAINTVQLDNAIAKVKVLNAEVASVRQTASVNANIRTSVQHSVDGSKAAESIGKAFDDGAGVLEKAIAKSFRSAQGGGIGGLLSMPFRMPFRVAQDMITGAGYELGRRATGGISAPLDKALENMGSQIEKYATRRANEYAVFLSKAAGFSGTKQVKEDVIDPLIQTIDDLTSPRRLTQKLRSTEKRLSKVAQDVAINKTSFIDALQKEYDKDIERVQDNYWKTVGQIAKAGIRTVGPALRINKDVNIAKQAQFLDKYSKRYNIDPDLVAEANRRGGVSIVAPGLHRQEGAGAEGLTDVIQQFDPKSVVIPGYNRDTDSPRPRLERLQGLYDKTFGRAFPYDLKNAVDEKPEYSAAVLKLLENELFGSKDAFKQAAYAKALRDAGVTGDIKFIGYSAGVSSAYEAMRTANMAGVDTRALGFGGIMSGLTERPVPGFTQFQGGYDWTSLIAQGGMPRKNYEENKNKLFGVPYGLIDRGFGAMPGTVYAPTAGFGHDIKAYLANPAVQDRMKGVGMAPNYSFYDAKRGIFGLKSEEEYRNQFDKAFPFEHDVKDLMKLAESSPAEEVQAEINKYIQIYKDGIKVLQKNAKYAVGRSAEEYSLMKQQADIAVNALESASNPDFDLQSYLSKISALDKKREQLYIDEPIINPGYSVLDPTKPTPQYTLPNYQVINSASPLDPAMWTPPMSAMERVQGQALEVKEKVYEFITPIVEAGKATREFTDSIVDLGRKVRALEDRVTGGKAGEIRQAAWDNLRNNWGVDYSPIGQALPGQQGALSRAGNVARGVYGGLQRGEQLAFDAAGMFLPGWVLPTAKKAIQYGGTFAAANALLPGVGGAILHGGGALGGAAGAGLGGALTSWLGGALPGWAAGALGSGATAALTGAGTTIGATGAGLLAARGAMNVTGKALDTFLPGSNPNQAAEQLTGKAFNLLGAGINKAANEFKPAQSVQAQIEGASTQLGLPPASELEAQNKQLREILKTIANLEQASKTLQSNFGTSVSRVSSGRFDYFDAANVGRAILGSERELAKTRYVQDFLRDQGLDQEFSQVNKSQLEIGRFKSRAYKALESQLPQIQAAAKAGDDTAQGFINALIESIPEIEKLANTTGQKYIAALKEALGVRSPSWITALIAEDVVQGFLNKGESGISELEKLAKEMGVSFTDEMRFALMAEIPEVKKALEEIDALIKSKAPISQYDQALSKLPDSFVAASPELEPTYQKEIERANKLAQEQIQPFLKDTVASSLTGDEKIRSQAEQLGRNAVNATAEGIRKGKEQIDSAIGFVMDRPEIKTAGAGLGGFFGGIRQGLDDIQKRFPILQQFKGQLVEIGFAVGGLIGAYSLGDFFVNFARGSLEVANGVDVLESRLQSFGTGQDYQGFERLMSIADELGLQYKTLEQDYLRMSSVLSKTEFADKAESVFKNLSKAVVGLQPGEVSRFFTAVTQVVEKGRLYREEFTGQFSDIPGIANTIKQAISGGDNAEFQKRLTDGSISSTEFIQKLTGYMELNGASLDNAATKAARFSNALTKLQAKSGEAIQPVFQTAMGAVGSFLGVIADNADIALVAISGLALKGFTVLTFAIRDFLAYNGILTGAMVKNALSMQNLTATTKAASVAVAGLAKTFLLFGGAALAIGALVDGVSLLRGELEASKDAIDRSERALQAYKEASKEVKKELETGVRSEKTFLGILDDGQKLFANINAELNKMVGLSERFGSSWFGTFGNLESGILQGQLAELSQRTLDAALEARGGTPEAARNAREQIESLRNLISNIRQGDPVRAESLKDELANAEATLKSMERVMGKLTESSGDTVSAFKSLADVMKGITQEFERQNRLIREQASNSRIGINAGILAGTLTPQQADRLRDQVDLQEQIANRNNLQRRLSESRSSLTVAVESGLVAAPTSGLTNDEIKKQQEEAQKEIDATADAIVQANQSISDAQVSIQQKLEQQQVATIESTRQLTQSIEEYYRNLQQQQRDLDRQVEDFVTNTGEELLQIRRDIRQAKSDRVLASKLVILRGALLKTSSDLVTGIIEQVISIVEAIHDRTRQRLQFEAQRQQINQQIRSLIEGPKALSRTINDAIYGNDQTRNQLNTQFIQAQGQQMGLSPLQIQKALTKSGLVNPVKGIWNAPGGYDADSGLDLLVPEGTKAVAAASGRLVYAERGHSAWMHEDASASMPGFQPQQSILIELDKPFNYSGKLIRYMWYTHLQAIEDSIKNKGSDVGIPTRIEAGQILGEIGKANNVPHLHFGLLSDRRQRHEGDWLNHRQVRDILYGSGGGLNLAPNIAAQPSQQNQAIAAEVISPLGADHLAGRSSSPQDNLQRYLARIAAGESSGGTNLGPHPATGAYGRYQFTPSTRQLLLNQMPGADPWSTDQTVAGQAALNWIKLYGQEKGVDILQLIRDGNFARADELLGRSQFTSLPGGAEEHAMWRDRSNLAKYGPSTGTSSTASTASIQTNLGLSPLSAPSVLPAEKVAAGAIAEYRNQLAELDKLQREQRILSDYQIKTQQESLKRSIEDTIKQNEQFIEANSFKAGLKDLYQGIPDELIPAELRNAQDSGYVGQFQQMTQELEQAQRDVTDLIEAAKFLEKLPEYKLGEAGITPELLGQLQKSLELRKSAVDRQLEELQAAQNLREAYEQINREREIADKDNAAIQDVLVRQLELQGQFAGQLASEGKIWESNAINRQKATQEIQNQLDLELRRINLLRQELSLGLDNGYTFEQLDLLQQYAQDSAKASSESVKTQYQTIAGSILETSKQAVQATISGFRQLVTESKSVGDFFENFFTRIIDTIGDALFSIVGQLATNGLFDALGGIFGGKRSGGSGNLLNTLFSVGTTAAGLFGGGSGAFFDPSGAAALAVPAGFGAFSTGTVLPGYGGGDRRPALLEDGEAVLRKEVVRELGIDLVKGWNEKGVTKAMRGFTPAPTINRGYQPKFSEPTEAPSTNQPLQVETQMINNVEYMTKAEGLRLAQEAANQGANSALSRLKNSVGTRKGLGF